MEFRKNDDFVIPFGRTKLKINDFLNLLNILDILNFFSDLLFIFLSELGQGILSRPKVLFQRFAE